MLKIAVFLALSIFSTLAFDCSQPKDTGNSCADGQTARAFYFDSRTKVCQPFLYSGCGGNDNRFATSKECRDSCQNKKPTPTLSTSTSSSRNTISDDSDATSSSPNSPPFVPHGNSHDQWRKAEICGSNYLIPNGKYITCSPNQSCPKFHSCVNGACCPSKDYVCSLRDDNGSFQDGVEDRPRFAWNHNVQSCTRWSYYGANGNYNNFPNFQSCMKYCQGANKIDL